MGTAVDFAATQRAAEEVGLLGGSGDYYKYKEGDNRFRLVSECLPHNGSYQGKPNFKWLCYVLDRRDGKVKAHFMPHKIYKSIVALQQNPEYTFSEVPMPYDLTVQAKGAGTKEVEYSVVPARKEVPLTTDELAEVERQKPLSEVKAKLDEKAAKSAPAVDEPPVHTDYDEPPF